MARAEAAEAWAHSKEGKAAAARARRLGKGKGEGKGKGGGGGGVGGRGSGGGLGGLGGGGGSVLDGLASFGALPPFVDHAAITLASDREAHPYAGRANTTPRRWGGAPDTLTAPVRKQMVFAPPPPLSPIHPAPSHNAKHDIEAANESNLE